MSERMREAAREDFWKNDGWIFVEWRRDVVSIKLDKRVFHVSVEGFKGSLVDGFGKLNSSPWFASDFDSEIPSKDYLDSYVGLDEGEETEFSSNKGNNRRPHVQPLDVLVPPSRFSKETLFPVPNIGNNTSKGDDLASPLPCEQKCVNDPFKLPSTNVFGAKVDPISEPISTGGNI
ncbi:hypothetical protein L6452_05817 [Arctium lappa]|uniref:Uncharacterized protein n=1 Tax=Arctium lappa TaxID=4217 RepID=A0ACB9EIH5_ARCLA|nr:hypothetical protein L6452_05817 [Arctium lappa]